MEPEGNLVFLGIVTLTLLVFVSTENLKDVFYNETSEPSSKCPLDFVVFNTNSSLTFCYRYKPPEHFDDYDTGCVGNLYTLEFAEDLFCQNGTDLEVWTDFKRMYEGGPLVKWSPSDGMGLLLNDIYQDRSEAGLRQSEARQHMCSVFNTSSGTVRSTSCNEKYSRLCVVRSYERLEEYDGCPKSFFRMSSPLAVCVAPAAASHQKLRVTWEQAQLKCSKLENSALLHSAYIYANHPDLQPSGLRALHSTYMPIGRRLAMNESDVYVESFEKLNKYDDPLQDIDLKLASINQSITALDVRNWQMSRVDKKGATFHYVLCERLIELPRLGMAVNYDESSARNSHLDNSFCLVVETKDGVPKGTIVTSKQIVINLFNELENAFFPDNAIELVMETGDAGVLSLTVNSSNVSDDGIWCFTDAKTIYPERVTVERSDSDRFTIMPMGDGYYWCINADTTNFLPEESNTALYIGNKSSIADVYAIKIYWEAGYTYSTLNRVVEDIWGALDEIFFLISSQQNKLDGNFGEMTNINTTKKTTDIELKLSRESSSRTPMKYLRPKRTDPNGHTLLLHLQLDSKFSALLPSNYAEFRVLYMRPVYFCQRNSTLPSLEMNKTENCLIYTCEGDFIEGLRFENNTVLDCSNQLDISSDMILTEDISADETQNARHNLIRSYWILNSDQPSSSSEESTPVNRPTPWAPHSPSIEDIINVTEMWSDQTTQTSTAQPTQFTTHVPTTTVGSTSTAEPTGTTVTPHEHEIQIGAVIANITQILESEELNVTTVNAAASQVSEVLDLDPEVPIPATVLHLLDRLGKEMSLGVEGEAVVAAPNLVIAAVDADAGSERALAGIRIQNNDTFSNDTVHFIWAANGSSDVISQTNEMKVKLPPSVQSNGRIFFVVFRSERAFNQGTAGRVNSRVVSVNLANNTNFQEGEFVEIHLVSFDTPPPFDNETKSCGYWDFNAGPSATGDWSTNGCEFRPAIDSTSLDVCACNHLTHFAEIITLRTANSSLSAANEAALAVISTVGCSFSLIGLTIIALTAAIFRSWRKEFSNKIWLHLSASITLLIIAFLTISLIDFKTGQYTTLCVAIGIILHYSVLSSFCWMFVAAVLSYQRLVVVFSRGESHQLLKACVFSWGLPCIIIGALLVVDPHNYEYKYKVNETVYMYTFCYPTNLGFWLTVFLPVLTAVAANTLLFCVIVFSVFGGSRVVRQNSSREAVRCITVSFLLIFLFGITWIFGLFAEVTFAAYIFCVTATFQGFVLFIFFVAGNKKTRDLWLNLLKLKEKKKIAVTSSSSATTRYKDAGGPPRAAAGFGTFEDAVNTKPRSLTGKDNGRFF